MTDEKRHLREQLAAQQVHPCFHGCTGWHYACCGGGLHWHGYPGYTQPVTISDGYSVSKATIAGAVTS